MSSKGDGEGVATRINVIDFFFLIAELASYVGNQFYVGMLLKTSFTDFESLRWFLEILKILTRILLISN